MFSSRFPHGTDLKGSFCFHVNDEFSWALYVLTTKNMCMIRDLSVVMVYKLFATPTNNKAQWQSAFNAGARGLNPLSTDDCMQLFGLPYSFA